MYSLSEALRDREAPPGRPDVLNYEKTPPTDVNLCFKDSANAGMIYFY